MCCSQAPCALAGKVRTDPFLEVILSAFTTAGGSAGLYASKSADRFGEIILFSVRHQRHDSLQKMSVN